MMAQRAEDLQSQFRFNDNELNGILKASPLLLSKKENILPEKFEIFRKNFGFTADMFKVLVTRHPKILSIPQPKIQEVYDYFLSKGLTQFEISKCVMQIPKILEQSPEHFKKISQQFWMSYEIKHERVMEIFKEFPYLMCVKEEKLKNVLEFFHDVDYTADDTVRILSRAGGILAIQKSALSGLFSTMKSVVGISYEDFADIVRHIPEIVLLGRHAMFIKKLLLIKRHSAFSSFYVKQLVTRHPDLFLGSIASMQAKMKLRFELNLKFKNERAFPLFMKLNYWETIRPRIDSLKGQKFDFSEAMRGTDNEFCKKFNVDIHTYQNIKEEHSQKVTNERD
jgi:hypothetical protein